MSRTSRRSVGFIFFGLASAVLAFVPVVNADADTDNVGMSPDALIRDMSEALTKLNYEGSFVHIQNDNIESMSIAHSNDNGGELEYMLSLNGEAREVFRNRALVTCIWPGTNSVIVSESKARQILPKVDESLTNSDSYQLTMGKSDRVAGRETYVVEIKPKDHYRYGYRFWIDKDTKMLLRSMLVDRNDNTVEQVMFTNISYPDSISADRFETPGELVETFKTRPVSKAALVPDGQNRVSFGVLPVGYAEITETYQPMPLNDRPMSHVMLSDGMASVSVYVEYIDKTTQSGVALGVSSMGAMNAFTRSLDAALITVVGEVPSATVEKIAHAVRLVE